MLETMTRILTIAISMALTAACGGTTGVVGDASTTDVHIDTGADTAAEPDGTVDPQCAPQLAAADPCVDCDAVWPMGWFWSGAGCFELVGCLCAGEGCAGGYDTREACEAGHAGCEPMLCDATGGVWVQGSSCVTCGHFVCGAPPPERCCSDGCDCGPGRTFVEGTGCATDPSCTDEELCRATHGTWYGEDPCGPCGHYHCGQPSGLPCCAPGCDCGQSRVFDESQGCVVAEECGPTHDDLCTTTGGTFHPADPCGPCGDYTCGEPSYDDCCDAGCDCGAYRVYDPLAGCVYSDACFDRDEWESCTGYAAGSTCRSGLVCCSAAGAMDLKRCMTPCCASDPWCMEDGCPVPPP